MKTVTLSLALASGLMLTAAPAMAGTDTLLVERVQSEAGTTLPARGRTMAEIEATFGAPSAKHAPIAGPNNHHDNPPITRWDYPNFSVYFENSHVIDAVLNKASPSETGPLQVPQQ